MTEQLDENKLIAERRGKLNILREKGNAFPNGFRRSSLAADLHLEYGSFDNEALESKNIRVTVAGRMMGKRVMGES